PGALRCALASRATARAMAAGVVVGVGNVLLEVGLPRIWSAWFAAGAPAITAMREEAHGLAPWFFYGSVTTVLVGPLMEEWLYRGVLWSALSRVLGPFATTSITAAVFTINHGPDRVRQFPLLFFSGVLLGMLRHRTR